MTRANEEQNAGIKTTAKRQLGRTDIEVAPLTFGGNVFGWTVDEATAFCILDAFVGEGFNLVDTANVYPYWVPGNSGGESETQIGNWLRRRPGAREKLVIATKVGFDKGDGTGGLSRARILQEVELSLRRLGVDYIDLYQSHIDDETVPQAETLDTYADLIRAGKIRAIGASNHRAERLEAALNLSARHGYPRYESVQPEYNLYNRADFEQTMAALCAREGLGILPYFTLASGFLTGKYRSETQFLASRRGQFVQGAWDTRALFGTRGLRILEALDTVAAELNATPAQIAIAWLLARGVNAPIASATSVGQLHELMRGARLALTPEYLTLLDTASAPL